MTECTPEARTGEITVFSLETLPQRSMGCCVVGYSGTPWREKLRVPTNMEREFRGLVKMPFQKQLQVASEQARQVHLLYKGNCAEIPSLCDLARPLQNSTKCWNSDPCC